MERVSAWYKSTPLSGDSGLTIGRSRKAGGSGAYEHPTLTRISRAVMLREAMADLLEMHRVVWSRSLKPSCVSAQVAGPEATLPFRLQRKDAR